MSAEATPQTEKPPRQRRRWPLSLRLFLIVLAIGGVVTVAVYGPRAYANWRAIREIEHVGGSFTREPHGSEFLRKLLGDVGMIPFDEITRVELQNSGVSDAGLAHLAGLNSLKSIDLSRTQVTDSGLLHLSKMSSLASLNLS